ERAVGQFLAAMVRDHAVAEDLCQETFLAALQQARRGVVIEHQRAWLLGVARHRALHHLRGWRRAQEALGRLASGREPSQPGPEPTDTRELLIGQLGPRDRALVILRYVHGFTGCELARLCGTSEEAVRQRLLRAARKLRNAAQSTATHTTVP